MGAWGRRPCLYLAAGTLLFLFLCGHPAVPRGHTLGMALRPVVAPLRVASNSYLPRRPESTHEPGTLRLPASWSPAHPLMKPMPRDLQADATRCRGIDPGSPAPVLREPQRPQQSLCLPGLHPVLLSCGRALKAQAPDCWGLRCGSKGFKHFLFPLSSSVYDKSV